MTFGGKCFGIAAAVSAVLLIAAVGSAALVEEASLSSTRSGSNWFGLLGVAADGDTIAVGEPKTNRLGKVYVFVANAAGVGLQAELDPPIPDDAAYFGASVALDGDTLAASQHGRVYVFSRSAGTWSHTATLEGSDGGFVASNGGANLFGSSIALRGGLMVVGGTSTTGCPTGEACYADHVWVFEKIAGSWVETAILVADDDPGDHRQRFGFAVATDGSSIVASAPLALRAAYVFERDGAGGWSQSAKVTTSTSKRSFGDSIDIEGNTLVVGDGQDSTPLGAYSGAVHVFTRDTAGAWTQEAKLAEAELAGTYAFLGTKVVVQGDRLLASAPGANAVPGYVYVYERGVQGWQRNDRLDCGGSGDSFGSALSIDSARAVVGGCLASDGITNTVRVYKTAADTDADGVSDDLDNCPLVSNALQGDVDGDGAGDACDLCTGDDATGDTDADGACDASDNCPSDFNPSQLDADSDGLGDSCEADSDGDGTIDDLDNCALVPNADQADSDGDLMGDVCDLDDDDDGVWDDADNCPVVANSAQLDTDADGLGDTCDGDDDADGVADEFDLCPGTPTSVPFDVAGCSGAQRIDGACGAPGDHATHGAYVSCVAAEGTFAVAAGLLTAQQRAAIVRVAARGH